MATVENYQLKAVKQVLVLSIYLPFYVSTYLYCIYAQVESLRNRTRTLLRIAEAAPLFYASKPKTVVYKTEKKYYLSSTPEN